MTLAVAGNPNSGKTTLFNRLTGLRQKTANYAGVTVEGKEGDFAVAGNRVHLIDLPGTYALTPQSEEQRIAAQVILGLHPGVPPVDGVLVVVDSTCLEKSLYLALQIIETGLPTLVVLNMADELALRGGVIDVPQLSHRLGVPVVSVSATRGEGLEELRKAIGRWVAHPPERRGGTAVLPLPNLAEANRRRLAAKHLARAVMPRALDPHPWSDRVDALVMHAFWGPLIFAGVVLVVFQSIFAGARPVMELLDRGFTTLAGLIRDGRPGSLPASFLADGVVAGVGSVVTFLPQILIVFFFLAMLEDSGYL
ncbi:MAG: FeoB small GTPase domain-containing protein, partial [bacterium]